MCEFSGKLIAWLDHELPEGEAAVVQQHVDGCSECRIQLERFGSVSRAIDSYCDAAVAPPVRRPAPHWALASTGVAAALVVLFFAFPRARVSEPPLARNTVATVGVSHANVLSAAPAPVKRVHRRRVVTAPPDQSVAWLPAEPTVEIAIPAEDMYPPGAVPAGVSFIVDVRFAADGSAQQVRMLP